MGRVGRSVGAVEPNAARANATLEDVRREASSESALGADRCPACVGPRMRRLGRSRRRVAALIRELRGGLATDWVVLWDLVAVEQGVLINDEVD